MADADGDARFVVEAVIQLLISIHRVSPTLQPLELTVPTRCGWLGLACGPHEENRIAVFVGTGRGCEQRLLAFVESQSARCCQSMDRTPRSSCCVGD